MQLCPVPPMWNEDARHISGDGTLTSLPFIGTLSSCKKIKIQTANCTHLQATQCHPQPGLQKSATYTTIKRRKNLFLIKLIINLSSKVE